MSAKVNKNLRVPYAYDSAEVSFLTGVDFDPAEDMAQQGFEKETDINELVKRFGITGDLPVAKELAQYGDFSEATDFQTAMEQLRRGEEAFMELPPEVRAHFENDPARMWAWLQEEQNRPEAEALGIVPETPQDRETEANEG